ncbi:hypothetical protein HYS90_00840 [Candidatus Curtissbacteria bacterium]|nr:hypothetical protein [Candidatus Curtissbacteria bacterium]
MEKMLMGMAKTMWMPSLLMGLAMVVIAFLVVRNTAQTSVAFFFSGAKAIREGTDPTYIAAHRSFQTTFAWIPGFKFLGMGLLFSAITFNLANIIGALREGGAKIQKALGVEVKAMAKPVIASLFPMAMMLGLLTLIVAFIISLNLAGQASSYFNNPIEDVLDAAQSNSALSGQLAQIQATKAWLEPFKFVGVALLLTGISLALATIRKILQFQAKRLAEIAESK